MTDRANRIVFLVEILVLALPATLAYAVLSLAFLDAFSSLTMLNDIWPSSSEAGNLPWRGYMIVAAPALFALGFSAFWVLGLRFLVAGRKGLGRSSAFLWVVAFLGQGIGLAVTLWSLVGDATGVAIMSFAPILGLILFLLPPLLHMVAVISNAAAEPLAGG